MAKRPPMNLNLDVEALQGSAVAQPDPVVEVEKARNPVVHLAPQPPAAKDNAKKSRASTGTPETHQKGRAGKVAVQTYVSVETRRRLKVLAAQTDVTIDEYLARAIEELLTRNKA